MTRVCLFLCVAACALLGTGWLAGQDQPGKVRGQLPTYWKQLGLGKDQVQKVYTIQTEFRTKIDALTAQITKLKAQEKAELEKVLTPAQKTKLREIVAGKDPEATTDKKPDPKKPEKE